MENFQLKDNPCYATVTSVDQERLNCKKPQKDGNKKIIACMILLFAAVFALLLGVAGACIFFALELFKLQNEIQTFQQLNVSIDMLSQTSNQHNGFITAHELNSSNEMLYQQLNLQNESIQFAFQQLNHNLTQELNSGIDQLHEVNSSINQLDVVISNRLDSILDRLEFPELYTLQPQCGDGFWKQVAHINMNDSSHQCPSAWQEYSQSATPPRYCVLPQGSPEGCVQTSFPVNTRYDKVCGRITGRSIHSTDGFANIGSRNDENYVDGISITHSSNRTHIWTFAADQGAYFRCPCSNTHPTNTPSFVGSNYFCDAFANGRLWDGDGCVTGEECCLFNSPPWFTVQLPEVATDDIDVRICIDERINGDTENVGIELLELFVQI